MITAKFRCQLVEKTEQSDIVKLAAVSDKANKQWAKWTPAGSLTMQIDNPDARGKFEPGCLYMLTFEQVTFPKAEQG